MTTPNSGAVSTQAANKGVKRGLPATGLPAAEEAARKLWDVARLGTTKPDAFAAQWGSNNKASGGAWRARMAMLRGFGLVRTKDDEVGLSDLGQRLVNDSDIVAQQAARREAVMNLNAYRDLVHDFEGTQLPDAATLASRLRYEYGKNPTFAQTAADAFLASLKHAGMLDASNTVRHGPDKPSDPELIGGIAADASNDDRDEDREADEIDEAFGDIDDETSINPEYFGGEGNDVSSALRSSNLKRADLVVTLELSRFRVDEVIQILDFLGYGRRAIR